MTGADLEPRLHLPEYRCSTWTQAQGVDPIGSAGTYDQLVLVEWPLPWPSDVGEIPELAEVAALPGARVMTVVPQVDATTDGLLRVVHRRRTSTHHLAGVDHLVPMADVPALVADLVGRPDRAQHDWTTAVGEAPDEVLVCAHGRRDPCCGRWGTLLHAELAVRLPQVRVWRCSHTGGHRFAPTAITLPDGRAWAYLAADVVDGVVSRTGEVAALVEHDRGSLAFDQWAQVVERALFARTGWAWLDTSVDASSTEVAEDRQSAVVRMTWRDGGTTRHAAGLVEGGRDLPVLGCGAPPEAATKTSPELVLRSLSVS